MLCRSSLHRPARHSVLSLRYNPGLPLFPPLHPRSHTAFFSAYRGNSSDTIGLGGLVKPLVVTSLPTIGYAAYTRSMPPQFLTFSLASCVGLHIYDRHMNAKGLHTEHMPIGHMNRRVF